MSRIRRGESTHHRSTLPRDPHSTWARSRRRRRPRVPYRCRSRHRHSSSLTAASSFTHADVLNDDVISHSLSPFHTPAPRKCKLQSNGQRANVKVDQSRERLVGGERVVVKTEGCVVFNPTHRPAARPTFFFTVSPSPSLLLPLSSWFSLLRTRRGFFW